ncbi:MAG: beta-lactamase family protein [Gemmatimonadales bacterium]|nr:beta-lactamase family protein [Gemmatimonadales bacterium]
MNGLILALLSACVAACGAPGTEPAETLADRLNRILADSAAANQVIGAQAAVLIPGKPLWVSVTGLNGPGDPMRPDLLIGTGSISKMFTIVAALTLIDRGVIRMDDQVGRWFPNTQNVDPAIRLERLLQQTSGLADYQAAPNYSQSIFADPGRAWQPAELLSFVGAPLFQPGAGWNASNTNSLLLGMIVERESGLTLGAFMKRDLWAGLTSTWFGGDGAAPGPLATQWSVDAAGNRTNYTETFFGPALFSSRREVQTTAADLARFAERLFGGDLLTPATKAAMLTIVPDDGGIPGQTGGGLGIRRYNYLGRTLYGHSGGTPNASSLVLFDPPTGIVVAVMVNQNGPSHRQSHFRIGPALLQAALAGN